MGEHSLYVSYRLGLLTWEPLGLTQLGECDSYKVEVVGSNPTSEIQDADGQGVEISFSRQIKKS